MDTKKVPLALFSIFCLKTLVTGVSYETTLCLAALGIISFLYEMFIQNKAIINFKNDIAEIKKGDEASKKELEAIKSYVSSLKLNNIRSTPNGLNRTAQY